MIQFSCQQTSSHSLDSWHVMCALSERKKQNKTVIWKPHTQIYNAINHMHMFYLKIIR